MLSEDVKNEFIAKYTVEIPDFIMYMDPDHPDFGSYAFAQKRLELLKSKKVVFETHVEYFRKPKEYTLYSLSMCETGYSYTSAKNLNINSFRKIYHMNPVYLVNDIRLWSKACASLRLNVSSYNNSFMKAFTPYTTCDSIIVDEKVYNSDNEKYIDLVTMAIAKKVNIYGDKEFGAYVYIDLENYPSLHSRYPTNFYDHDEAIKFLYPRLAEKKQKIIEDVEEAEENEWTEIQKIIDKCEPNPPPARYINDMDCSYSNDGGMVFVLFLVVLLILMIVLFSI